MSGRAASRLIDMGFVNVLAYEPGKSDWFAAGLERAGEMADMPRIGDFAEDAATCAPDDSVGEAAGRARAQGWDACVVVNDEGVVLGLLRSQLSAADPDAIARDVMHEGPKTYRADYPLPDPVQYMESRRLGSTLVTTPEGTLLGMARLLPAKAAQEEVERLLAAAGHRHEE